jgi:hypothetical protein
MPLVKTIALALTVLAATGVAGCSEAAEQAERTERVEPGLLGALWRVRATDNTRKYVEYGNVAQIRALVDADRQRFLSLTGSGMSRLGQYYQTVSEDLAFDPLSFREAVTVGYPPDWSGILWGDYDVDAVNQRFADLGVERSERDGATFWTADPNGGFQVDAPLTGIAGPATLNNVRTRPGSFAFSPRQDTLTWVTEPGDDTLAGDPTITALAGCLGEVISATFHTEAGTRPEPVAVGVRAPSAADATDIICVAPNSRDRAAEILRHTSELLATGRTSGPGLGSGQPWSTILPNATAELTGESTSVVRIVSSPGADHAPGQTQRLMSRGELTELLGLHSGT